MKNVKIIIADRGWVFIGDKTSNDNEEFLELKSAYVIRRWGTSEGLGELCIKGKLEDTILDKCMDVSLPIKSIIAILDCDQEKWKNL